MGNLEFRKKVSQGQKDNWKNNKVRRDGLVEKNKLMWMDEDYVKNILTSSSNRNSSFSVRVGEYLKKFDDNWESEFHVSGTRYHIDWYNAGLNIGIECQGAYWHCDSNIYPKDYFHSRLGLSAVEIWAKDNARASVIRSHGIKLFYLKEELWKSFENSNHISQDIMYLFIKHLAK